VRLYVLLAQRLGAKSSIAAVEYARKGTLGDVVDHMAFKPCARQRRLSVHGAIRPEATILVECFLGLYVFLFNVFDELVRGVD